MRVKKHENLTEANISNVIELLQAEKPITKKEACSILNIAYNTTRLNNIIAEFRETMEFRAIRKAQNKGKGATKQEITATVKMYLDGSNFTQQDMDNMSFITEILDDSGAIGSFELGNIKMSISNLDRFEEELVVCES